MRDAELAGKIPYVFCAFAGAEWEIDHCAARFAEKVRMFFEIRAIARWLSLVGNGFDKAAAGQCVQAVIDRRERNRGHFCADPREDFHRRRMVALAHEDIINGAALVRHSESASVDCLIGCLVMVHLRCHAVSLTQAVCLSRIIPIKIPDSAGGKLKRRIRWSKAGTKASRSVCARSTPQQVELR